MELAAINKNQLRDYASLFSRSVALEWFKLDFKNINLKILRYDSHMFSSNSTTYFDYLKYVYSILEKNYPNEYIYKNSFLNEWIIKELGNGNSKVFSEFKLNNAVADLVMFNSLSKVFEIKTELDSTKRLGNQLETYKSIFNEIYLIVPKSKLHLYLNYDISIGVISYCNKNEKKFILERKSELNIEVNHQILMNILHTSEYKNIVKQYHKEIPEMNSFNQFKICSSLISQIPSKILNELFINQLKNRGMKNYFSTKIYAPFHQLSLALQLGKKEQEILFQNLKTPINL